MAVESLLRISNTSPEWIPPSPVSSGHCSPSLYAGEQLVQSSNPDNPTVRSKESSPVPGSDVARQEEVVAVSNNTVRKPSN